MSGRQGGLFRRRTLQQTCPSFASVCMSCDGQHLMSYSSPSLGKPVVAFTSLVPTVNQNKREVILRRWSYGLQRHVDLWVRAVCFFPETSERQ
jgi:hypothetical protein